MNYNLTFYLRGIDEEYLDVFKDYFVCFIQTLDPNIFTLAHLYGDSDGSSATFYMSFGKSYFEKECIDE